MIDTNIIKIVGFDGVEIANVTINEFKLLTRLFDELWDMDKLKVREMLFNGKTTEIAEDFLNIYDPNAVHNSKECLGDSELEVLKTLYPKLKAASYKQIVYIVTTLINSEDFLYMFRLNKSEESKANTLKAIGNEMHVLSTIFTKEDYKKAGNPYGDNNEGYNKWHSEKFSGMVGRLDSTQSNISMKSILPNLIPYEPKFIRNK